MKTQVGFILATIAAKCVACGWDNDTLAAETKGLLALTDAIMGRVPIYPREYYEFRIARSGKIVAQDTANLDELDNLIVAYDKVGDAKHAFYYAELKRKALLVHPNKDHEYRYYANLGTVEAHTWVRQKDHTDKKLLDLSIQHLKKCIEINPNAHFGREIVQLRLIEMMRKTKKPANFGATEVDRNNFENYDLWGNFVQKTGAANVQKGVIGIMSIGSGSDNPDLLCALVPSVDINEGHIIELIHRRLNDVWPSKMMFADIGYDYNFHQPADAELFKREYAALKENTATYRSSLDTYIKDRVAKGSHPDVDPHFWDDWKEPARVDLKAMEPRTTQMQRLWLFIGGSIFALVLSIILICRLVTALYRRYARK